MHEYVNVYNARPSIVNLETMWKIKFMIKLLINGVILQLNINSAANYAYSFLTNCWKLPSQLKQNGMSWILAKASPTESVSQESMQSLGKCIVKILFKLYCCVHSENEEKSKLATLITLPLSVGVAMAVEEVELWAVCSDVGKTF